MKKWIIGSLMLSLGWISNAQEPCATGRYADEIFSNVTVTSNVVYGSNYNFNGTTIKTLKMDIYEPTGDVEALRPLIVWVHGGSFLGGTKTDIDVVALSNSFAKKGYVCASIDYRTGFFPIDSVNSIKAVLRAVHDLKAAVRFFYKDQADDINAYGIDTTNIFIGGVSAGAITALHYAYMNKTCEGVDSEYMTQATLDQSGGMEGISGNPCYSTDVKGVINLCGALASYSWLEAGDIPLVSMHGTEDGTVGYSRQIVNPGVPLMYLDGSRMINEHALALGVENPFYTWYGADHDPFTGTNATALAYMDTTINFVRDFLIGQLGCTNTALQAANTPFGTAPLYPFTECTTDVLFTDCTALSVEEAVVENKFLVYPNPAQTTLNITFKKAMDRTIQLTDLSGVTQLELVANTSDVDLNISSLSSGVYLLHISTEYGEVATSKIIVE